MAWHKKGKSTPDMCLSRQELMEKETVDSQTYYRLHIFHFYNSSIFFFAFLNPKCIIWGAVGEDDF